MVPYRTFYITIHSVDEPSENTEMIIVE